jgi:hypothetical protein
MAFPAEDFSPIYRGISFGASGASGQRFRYSRQAAAKYRPAYHVELAVDRLVAPDLVDLAKGGGKLADTGQVDVIYCGIGHSPSVHDASELSLSGQPEPASPPAARSKTGRRPLVGATSNKRHS